MPNYVKCRLIMRNIKNAPLFTEDERKELYFDFNKITAMPKSLDIESGSMTDICIVYYLTDGCALPLRAIDDDKKVLVRNLLVRNFNGESWPQEAFERALEHAYEQTEKNKCVMYRKGKTYVENYQKHGAPTWYDWRIEHWGTKWNACDSEIINGNVVEFTTVWSAPIPIIEKLSKMYPEEIVSIKWADECAGCNAGEVAYRNGLIALDETDNVIMHNIPADRSNEAFEIYTDLWGETNCFIKDADENWKRNDCETCHGCD